MADFADNFPNSELQNALGDSITYQRASARYAIKATINVNVERIGNDGVVIRNKYEAEILKADLPIYPTRGDHVLFKSKDYLVDAIIEDDGYFVTVVLR